MTTFARNFAAALAMNTATIFVLLCAMTRGFTTYQPWIWGVR